MQINKPRIALPFWSRTRSTIDTDIFESNNGTVIILTQFWVNHEFCISNKMRKKCLSWRQFEWNTNEYSLLSSTDQILVAHNEKWHKPIAYTLFSKVWFNKMVISTQGQINLSYRNINLSIEKKTISFGEKSKSL